MIWTKVIVSFFIGQIAVAQGDFWPDEDAFTLTAEAENGQVELEFLTGSKYAIRVPENFPLNESLVNLNYQKGKILEFEFWRQKVKKPRNFEFSRRNCEK